MVSAVTFQPSKLWSSVRIRLDAPLEISICDLIVSEMATTRQVWVSTSNVRTDGLPGDPQNDVNNAYTLMSVTDYGPDDPASLSTGGVGRRAVDVTNVRTGDQKI